MNSNTDNELRPPSQSAPRAERSAPEDPAGEGSAGGFVRGRHYKFVEGVWRHARARRARRKGRGHRRFGSGLTPLEECELAERIKMGDMAARERLILGNLRLVKEIAANLQDPAIPFEDLVQEGNIGLIKAVERFDPSKHGARFVTYATFWIRALVQRALIKHGSLVRLPEYTRLLLTERNRKTKKKRAKGATKHVAEDAAKDVAKEAAEDEPEDAGAAPEKSKTPDLTRTLPLTPRQFRRLAESRVETVSLTEIGDVLVTPEQDDDAELVTVENRQLLHELLKGLPPFEEWLIRERFGLGGNQVKERRRRPLQPRRYRMRKRKAGHTPAAVKARNAKRKSRAFHPCSFRKLSRRCGLKVWRLRLAEQAAIKKLKRYMEARLSRDD